MSETEPIVPTSSVTALRIPIIKKGEYDLWSMKMRQYIAITDHILWDIITNGNQTTTDPDSLRVLTKDFSGCKPRRNNEKALNILLSAIPEDIYSFFNDADEDRAQKLKMPMEEIDISEEHVHFGQDGLGDFDWSNKDDDTPVSLALMATNSEGNPEEDLKDYAIIDSGCSGSMTGDKDKLSDFKEFKGGYVAFGNDSKGGRIFRKGQSRHQL
ncbi:hypothetical protein Tco_0585243 [Tanacetum coccineum]